MRWVGRLSVGVGGLIDRLILVGRGGREDGRLVCEGVERQV